MKKLILAGILAIAGIAFVSTQSADASWYGHHHGRPVVVVNAYPYYYGYPYSYYYYAPPGYATYYATPGPVVIRSYPVVPYYYGGYDYGRHKHHNRWRHW